MLASSFFREWELVRSGTLACAPLIPDDRLDFRPQPDLMELGELTRHINGAVYYMLKHVMGLSLEIPLKIRKKEPLNAAEFQEALRSTDEHVRRFLTDLNPEDLEKTVPRAQKSGKNWTIGYLVWHLQEHEIHHRAQLKLYLKLLGKDTSGLPF